MNSGAIRWLIAISAFCLAMLLGRELTQAKSGLFVADYYYLPLREFVDESRHAEMEELVIELSDRSRQRSLIIGASLLAIPLVCLLLCWPKSGQR